MGRIAAIDFGLKRLGVALSDEMKMIASSSHVLLAKKSTPLTVEAIVEHLSPHDVELVVVGYPLHLNGDVGFMADEVTHFVEKLKEHFTVVLFDERLSTSVAERALREAKMNRKKRSKVVDAVAATIILQNYLDMNSSF